MVSARSTRRAAFNCPAAALISCPAVSCLALTTATLSPQPAQPSRAQPVSATQTLTHTEPVGVMSQLTCRHHSDLDLAELAVPSLTTTTLLLAYSSPNTCTAGAAAGDKFISRLCTHTHTQSCLSVCRSVCHTVYHHYS